MGTGLTSFELTVTSAAEPSILMEHIAARAVASCRASLRPPEAGVRSKTG
jgi:hypothetical protein